MINTQMTRENTNSTNNTNTTMRQRRKQSLISYLSFRAPMKRHVLHSFTRKKKTINNDKTVAKRKLLLLNQLIFGFDKRGGCCTFIIFIRFAQFFGFLNSD